MKFKVKKDEIRFKIFWEIQVTLRKLADGFLNLAEGEKWNSPKIGEIGDFLLYEPHTLEDIEELARIKANEFFSRHKGSDFDE